MTSHPRHTHRKRRRRHGPGYGSDRFSSERGSHPLRALIAFDPEVLIGVTYPLRMDEYLRDASDGKVFA